MALLRIAASASRTRISRRCARTAFFASVLSFTALLAGSAFGQNLQSSNDQNSIRGTVVNAVTHAPIARALVHSADEQYAMMSDSDGHFEFTAPVGTQIWLLARKPGYLGDRNTGNALETSAGNEITIPLTPESIIKGRVSTSAGETLPRISVQLLRRQIQNGFWRWTQAAMAQTKSDGSFRFAELASGSYKVMTHEYMDNDQLLGLAAAQRYGFPPVYFPAAADFSGAATIDLASGQTFEANLTITDQPYYPVKIPVGNGEMNGGLEVRVTLQGRSGPGYSLGYNASTHKIEGLLPNGNYTVQAFTYGQDSASGEANLRVAGGPAEGSMLTLTQNSSVTLELQEVFTQSNPPLATDQPMGRPRRGPQSYLFPQLEPADDFAPWGGGNVRRQNDQNDSSLVIENIRPGRYWLRLNPRWGYVASATMGGVDLLHQPFDIGSGSNLPIEVTMRDDAATLEGMVSRVGSASSTSPSSTSQTWIYCVPMGDGPGIFQETSVSTDAKFNFQLPPGTYRVMAFASPNPDLPYREPEAMRAYDTKGQVIQLSAGQTASVQLQITPDE
jgi:hypothetical protein